MAQKILVVDDEQKVLDVIVPYLEREGFQMRTALDGRAALEAARAWEPDLIVLDWMLPEVSGLDVCRELRKDSRVAIILLTARSDEADRVVGLEIGADDYLVKPFGLRELTARIRAVLRRATAPLEESPVLRRGEIAIDPDRFKVWRDDREIQLTPTEFKILLTLAERPGVIYSRLQLSRAAMGTDYLQYERTVDTHISHLRRKIEDDPAEPQFVQTVYGVGYRFGEQ